MKINLILKEIRNALGENVTVEYNKVSKNNGLVLNGITIRTNNDPISPTVYLENYNESLTSKEIAKLVVTDYEKEISDSPMKNISVSNVMNFDDFAKHRIIYRLVNKKANEELLKTIPHRIFLDLAIIYVIQISDEASAKVTNNLMKHWNINEETLYNLATENTPKIFPSSISSLLEMMGKMTEMTIEDIENMGLRDDYHQIVITNNTNTNGAIALLYPGTVEYLYKRYGKFAVLPSSIHEVIIVPMNDNIEMEMLSQTVREVNAEVVANEEVLSDHAYLYDGEWK